MTYNKFAYVYDYLMTDAPYKDWVELTEKLIEKYELKPKLMIDLGCGTGNITIPLKQKGYQLIGLDISDDMLAIAHEKMIENQLSIPFLQQDIKEFELIEQVDLAISFCDSLNYLGDKTDLIEAFKQVNKNLTEQGYFIFDMHSVYKLQEIFNGNTFAWNDDDLSVIWLTDVNQDKLTVEHDLTFFVRNDEETYEKFNEVHRQQTFTIEEVEQMLKEAGFKLLEVFGDFQIGELEKTNERIFYVASKVS